jgi:hypothetical protein
MEDKSEVWPPPITSRSPPGPVRSQRPLNIAALLAGVIASLVSYGIIWHSSYRSCYPPDTSGFVAVAQLPFGLAAPLLPKFVIGLGLGIVGLLVFLFVLQMFLPFTGCLET